MKMPKQPAKPRIVFKTKDGSLIMDREAYDIETYIKDSEFCNYSLGIDARQKGVRIVSSSILQTGITCIVEYL